MELKGKTVLITGGASGIGLEAANQFLSQGAKVIITGRNQDKLNAAKHLYPALTAIKSDAADAKDASVLYNQVEALGGIDILYHNAGVGSPTLNLAKPYARILENATYEMNVNYFGVISLNNLLMEHLKSKSEAAIIITTSLLSMVPSLEEPTYSASKAALGFYTKILRKNLEILNSTVKVFELQPPLVETELTARRTDKKISPAVLVKGLISGLKGDHYTIRIGDSKTVYFINRFFPTLAFNLVNPKKIYSDLK